MVAGQPRASVFFFAESGCQREQQLKPPTSSDMPREAALLSHGTINIPDLDSENYRFRRVKYGVNAVSDPDREFY